MNTVNKLESLPTWSTTAIIINWDDSDGWYDQVMPPIVSPSSDPVNDGLNGPGQCGQGASPLGVEDRCGYGPRIPILGNIAIRQVATTSTTPSRPDLHRHLHRVQLEPCDGDTRPAGSELYDTMAGSITNMFNFRNKSGAGRGRRPALPQSCDRRGRRGGPAASAWKAASTTGSPTLDQPSHMRRCSKNKPRRLPPQQDDFDQWRRRPAPPTSG